MRKYLKILKTKAYTVIDIALLLTSSITTYYPHIVSELAGRSNKSMALNNYLGGSDIATLKKHIDLSMNIKGVCSV